MKAQTEFLTSAFFTCMDSAGSTLLYEITGMLI